MKLNLSNLFKKKKQFIPFISCGFPTKKDTVEIIKLFLDEGIEIVEIGLPFSDPVADGPTIQYSSFVSLKNGLNVDDLFDVIERTLNYKSYSPVIMTYLNPVIMYGVEKFVKTAKDVGVKGIIFADSIVEERNLFYPLMKKYDVQCIFLLAPTTSVERRKLIYKYTTGFVYVITLTGTTGVRNKLPVEFYKFIKQIRTETSLPLCAGFGISNPKQVLPVIDYIDGFIVGSAVIEKIKECKKSYKPLKDFVKQFVEITVYRS